VKNVVVFVWVSRGGVTAFLGGEGGGGGEYSSLIVTEIVRQTDRQTFLHTGLPELYSPLPPPYSLPNRAVSLPL